MSEFWENKIIKMRPSCISQWYSLNLDEKNLSVESIPFGLSNEDKEDVLYLDGYGGNSSLLDFGSNHQISINIKHKGR